MKRLDPTVVRAQIEALKFAYPDIWDDEADRGLALESETELADYLAAVVDRMQEAETRVEGIDLLFQDWRERKARFERRIDAMRELAFKVMSAAEQRKIELDAATLSIRAGTPRVIVTDEAALPIECVRFKREPNKTEIKDRLARGETVAGAELSNAEPVLTVRTK